LVRDPLGKDAVSPKLAPVVCSIHSFPVHFAALRVHLRTVYLVETENILLKVL